jgi:hypothetical protein
MEHIEYKGHTITIQHDDDPTNPRTEYDNTSKMICWHNKYKLGDQHNWNVESFTEYQEQHPEHLYLPLYLYDHSGITISTGPFNCPWDSGQVGWIYIESTTINTEFGGDRAKAERCLEAEVKEYDDYLTGETYGWIVDGESCWGFLGYDNCLADAKSVVDAMTTTNTLV